MCGLGLRAPGLRACMHDPGYRVDPSGYDCSPRTIMRGNDNPSFASMTTTFDCARYRVR